MSRSLVFMIVVAGLVLAALIIATLKPAGPLDVFDGCPLGGAARSGEKVADNMLKNRYEAPKGGDFDATVNLQSMLSASSSNSLDNTRAVRVIAYVKNVRSGGVESCNCHARNEVDQDTHIELVPMNGDDARKVVVAEVTPRTRALAAKQGFDWTTEALRESFLGRRILVEGWLYFDPDHIDQSFANDPRDILGRPNWRGTCWEIHPVTRIELAG